MTVEISNPNILDLAEWMQVVNEVNTLSRRVDAIITNSGAVSTGSVDWNSSKKYSQEFNLGAHKITFGKVDCVVANETTTGYFVSGDVLFADLNVGNSAFSGKPIITATIQFGNTTLPEQNDDLVITIFNASSTGFSYRVMNAGSHTVPSGHFYINWIAIGPK